MGALDPPNLPEFFSLVAHNSSTSLHLLGRVTDRNMTITRYAVQGDFIFLNGTY